MVSTNKKLRAEGKSSLEINKILEDETLAQAKGVINKLIDCTKIYITLHQISRYSVSY